MKERKHEKKGKTSRRRGEKVAEGGEIQGKGREVGEPSYIFFFIPSHRQGVFPAEKELAPPPPFRKNGGYVIHFLHCSHMSTMPCLQHVLLGACELLFSVLERCHAQFREVRHQEKERKEKGKR